MSIFWVSVLAVPVVLLVGFLILMVIQLLFSLTGRER